MTVDIPVYNPRRHNPGTPGGKHMPGNDACNCCQVGCYSYMRMRLALASPIPITELIELGENDG